MFTPRFLRGALVALVIFVLADWAWHGYLLMDYYNQEITSMGGALPAGMPAQAILFYLIMAAGTAYFVQETKPKDWMAGLQRGAFLGLMIGGAINLVNGMLFPGWDWTLIATDAGWGVVTGAIAGALIVKFGKT